MFEDDLDEEDLDVGESGEDTLDEVADIDIEDEAVIIDDVSDDEDDDSYGAPAGKRKQAVQEDAPSLQAKQKDRDTLASAMAEFLARGGKIQEVNAADD